ncbi:MAG: hypothetical protein HN909_01365, partial [Phycisphaerales bacterium]|nr:hypothetical protein [Phycisphaerales bacterium]
MMKMMKQFAILAVVASASLAMAEGRAPAKAADARPEATVMNRAFTGKGKLRDESTLLILTKPKILINEEQSRTAPPAARRGDARIARLEATVMRLSGEVRSLRAELAKVKAAKATDRAPQRDHDRKPPAAKAPAKRSYESHRAEMMKRIQEKMAALKKGPSRVQAAAKPGCPKAAAPAKKYAPETLKKMVLAAKDNP